MQTSQPSVREDEVSTLIPILDRDHLVPSRALPSLITDIPTRPNFTHVIHLLDVSAANTANARFMHATRCNQSTGKPLVAQDQLSSAHHLFALWQTSPRFLQS